MCISLIINEAKHTIMYLADTCASFLLNCMVVPFAHFPTRSFKKFSVAREVAQWLRALVLAGAPSSVHAPMPGIS